MKMIRFSRNVEVWRVGQKDGPMVDEAGEPIVDELKKKNKSILDKVVRGNKSVMQSGMHRNEPFS